MIKKKKIIIPATPSKEVEVNIYVCDVCGNETEYRLKPCHLCARLMCNRLGACSFTDPTDFSDYPDLFCKFCYELKGKTYWEALDRIEEEYNKRIKELEEKIKQESLALVITKI